MWRCPANHPSRPAFTLLELLIAVGLTSILMVSLFAALSISFNLQLDSHEEITREQIARAVLRQMTREIQSVVFVKKTVAEDDTSGTGTSSSGSGTSGTSSSGTTGSGTGGSGSGGSTTGSSTTGSSTTGTSTTGSSTSGSSSGTTSLDGNSYGQSSIDPETVMTTYTNGLVGGSSDLQLFVSRPDRTLAYVNAQEMSSTTERSSDLLIIRYLMADKGAGGLALAIAERESQGSDNGPVGLARMEGDLFGLSTAVQTDEDYPQLTAAKLQAAEVSGIQFRYFDGINWQETWDSTALNEMPKAIEIILTLRDQETGGAALRNEEADPYALPETTHRMVVPIPVAEPYVTETAL